MKKKYFLIKTLFGNMFKVDTYDNLEDVKKMALAMDELELQKDRKTEIKYIIIEGWE